jgi:beta-phosphoglucomutase-like phosphatase (HAD superfamily)
MGASGEFDLVIFDCDGVLVDCEVIACRAVSEVLVEFGFTLPVDEIAERFIGSSTKDMYAALEREWRCVLPDVLKARIGTRSRELFDRELRPVKGVAEVLEELSGRRCVASSSGPEAINYKLGRTKLLGYFDAAALFSSHMVSRGKPAPDLFPACRREHGDATGALPCDRGQRSRRDRRQGCGDDGLWLHRRQPLRGRPQGTALSGRCRSGIR